MVVKNPDQVCYFELTALKMNCSESDGGTVDKNALSGTIPEYGRS